MLDKKDYVCLQPFTFVELFDHKSFMCCPNWLPVDLGDPNKIKENWNSEKADDVRISMLDGSYRHCIESRCPKLTGLKEGKTDGFMHKSEFKKRIDEFKNVLPKEIKFNFDQSCNLMCPSCRVHKINYEGKQRNRTEELLKNVEEQLAEGLERIDCTGSGDPFFSRTFRKWLMTFNPALYPNLKRIHLHTNGTLWNESNWSRMTKVHKLVKSAEISIDAATKETYENFTRLGGKWEDIYTNLHYIAKQPYLETVTLSFVVQQSNYKEMKMFYDMGEEIFGNTRINWSIFYNRVVNWGTFEKKEFETVDVGNPEHPEYNDLLDIYKTLPVNSKVRHNLTIPQRINIV